jgi:peptide deformylase
MTLACKPICQVLYYPHPNLRLDAKSVTQFDDQLKQLVDAMFETMYKYQGIGLAATQVNIQQQIIVMDVEFDRKHPHVFINPVITEKSGEQIGKEGCLSIPGIFEEVTRADFVRVKALDIHGKEFELEATGLLSACIQHENDHLTGKLFIDYLSRLKQQLIIKKMKKLQKIRM